MKTTYGSIIVQRLVHWTVCDVHGSKPWTELKLLSFFLPLSIHHLNQLVIESTSSFYSKEGKKVKVGKKVRKRVASIFIQPMPIKNIKCSYFLLCKHKNEASLTCETIQMVLNQSISRALIAQLS